MVTEQKMPKTDYPALYQAASSTSQEAQKTYMQFVFSFLVLLVAASASFLFSSYSWLLSALSALLFFGTLILSLLLASKRYDETWYKGRALAESVKTLTWRYIMRAKPYDDTQPSDYRTQFRDDLKKLLDNNRDMCLVLSDTHENLEQITEKMESIRKSSLQDRKKFYQLYRIVEQRDWYTTKAIYNKRMAKRWFIAMIIFQSLAIISALIKIPNPDWNLLPVQVFAVSATAVLSWIQIKRFQDLATSYSITVQDIGMVKVELPVVVDEQTFSDFVINVETAFSREHTEWLARRNIRKSG